MGRAAQDEAAGGQAAWAARTRPDPATLERVHAALLGQLGGAMPEAPPPQVGPSGYMDSRAATSLYLAGLL
jgi:hypothetical protein